MSKSLSIDASIPIETVIYGTNRGLGHTLADGLKMCRHELVARVDADDISTKNRFELQFNCFVSHPEISVVGGLPAGSISL